MPAPIQLQTDEALAKREVHFPLETTGESSTSSPTDSRSPLSPGIRRCDPVANATILLARTKGGRDRTVSLSY